jgi:DNA-binding XRE family transcriptional regulator
VVGLVVGVFGLLVAVRERESGACWAWVVPGAFRMLVFVVSLLKFVGGGVSEPLGLALRRIREARGLTVEELAKKSGVAAITIKDTEQGESRPRTGTIARLAKPLGLTFEEVWSL